MEGACPHLLDLILKKREWGVKAPGDGSDLRVSEVAIENLELTLGLPSGKEDDPSLLSLGLSPNAGAHTTLLSPHEPRTQGIHQQQDDFIHWQRRPGTKTHEAAGNAAGVNMKSQARAPSVPVVGWPPIRSFRKNLATCSSRAPSVPVVGWPPIRSFRKNLATCSSKPPAESQSGLQPKLKPQNCKNGLFVKINMEGIPIGRKIDLSAFTSYDKLPQGVEDLFRGLLEAQKIATPSKEEEEIQAFKGLLDGTGEYTLVYEDYEGDRMLVGDVPWDMFVSMAKRLRVLKSTDLSAMHSEPVCRKRTAALLT